MFTPRVYWSSYRRHKYTPEPLLFKPATRNYTQWLKNNAFFKNSFNCFYFRYKKIMLPSKQPVINEVLITYIDYSITENYIGKMASFLPYTRPEILLKVHHHIY